MTNAAARRYRPLAAAALAAAAFSLGNLRFAAAATGPMQAIDVEPTLIHVSTAAPTSAIAVTNSSALAIRIQVGANAWKQTADGQAQLTDQNDIVVYPLIFTLAPGESRQLRVGTTVKSDAVQRAYRVSIDTLPAEATTELGQRNVNFRVRLSVPVFVDPAEPKVAGSLSSVSVDRNRIAFQAVNTGNVYYKVDKIRVVAKDASGSPIASGDVPGWYVLANDFRNFSLPIGPGICARVASVELTAAGQQLQMSRTFTRPAAQCSAG